MCCLTYHLCPMSQALVTHFCEGSSTHYLNIQALLEKVQERGVNQVQAILLSVTSRCQSEEISLQTVPKAE